MTQKYTMNNKKLQTEFMMKDEEVAEDKYWYMLEVLPPERMVKNAFLVGEPYDHAPDKSGKFSARYQLYFREGARYFYGGLTSVDDFEAFLI